MTTPRIRGLLPLPPDVAQEFCSLGLTDEDLVMFDDFLLSGPRRRTREVLLTFVRYLVRRRNRPGVAVERPKQRISEAVREAVLGKGPAQVHKPATEDALKKLDDVLGAVGEGARAKAQDRAVSRIADVLRRPSVPSPEPHAQTPVGVKSTSEQVEIAGGSG
jgi:hypothetical protein